MNQSPPEASDFVVIAGATAVGKSELAVAVAEQCNGEIVGADAFQVYAGLDILTAKPGPELLARVHHHLVGEVPLSEAFDVASYIALARGRIAEIRARGRVAVVCGGTGLYLRALTRGLADLPAADPELRAELENEPLHELARRLAELDPVAAASIDLQNPRRVVRALEICLLTRRPFSSFREQWDTAPATRGWVVTRERGELNARIDSRTIAMFAAGVEDEVRNAGEIVTTASQVLGLREIRALIAGKISRDECVRSIQQATRQYAKRQATWFRRETSWETVSLGEASETELLAERIAAKIASKS